jgi:peptidyl-Asp metalloendopeptidase
MKIHFALFAAAVLASGIAAAQPMPSQDFDGDGRSDILYRKAGENLVYRIEMNGLSIVSGNTVYHEPDPSWRIVGDGDFNADGISDLVWRHVLSGQVYLQPFNAAGVPEGGAIVYTEPNPDWKIVQTPDLDGDGRSDLLWWNATTGQVYAVLIGGSLSIAAEGHVFQEPDTNWRIAAVGDFSGSGTRNQLLWRHEEGGHVYLMTVTVADGAFFPSGQLIYQQPEITWKIVAAADFNGDGKSDILWRNSSTGLVWMFLMDGPTITASNAVYQEPDRAWQIVAQGDYDGDGKADLLWRNEANGLVYMMLMDGFSIASQGTVYSEPDLLWKVQGPREYGLQQ